MFGIVPRCYSLRQVSPVEASVRMILHHLEVVEIVGFYSMMCEKQVNITWSGHDLIERHAKPWFITELHPCLVETYPDKQVLQTNQLCGSCFVVSFTNS